MVTCVFSNADIGGFAAHASFPPPPESAAASYQAAALYRINIQAAKHGGKYSTSPLKQVAEAPDPRRNFQPTTPARSPIRLYT